MFDFAGKIDRGDQVPGGSLKTRREREPRRESQREIEREG